MATPLKTENKAEIKLTVGSLEVLGDVSGAGMNTIKRKISSVENAVTSVTEKTNEYWKAVATDNIITPEEKWELKKDWTQIDQTYTAIMETAESKAMQDDPVIIQLKQAHEDLENYLFQKLRLFEDMASNTEIPNVIEFNQKFSIFYDKQYKAQSYLTTGTMGYQDFQFAEGTHDNYPEEEEAWKDSPPPIAYNKYLWFRTRWTNEAGSGNWTYSRIKGDSGPKVYAEYSRDTKSWHEVFSSFQDRYMRLSYDMGETWTEAMKVVGEDGDFTYLGIRNDASTLPPAKDGNYFLAGEDFIIESYIIVNGRALMVNGHFLAATRAVEKGFIYICESGSWQKIEDKNDYRYVISVNDLIEIGEQISPALQSVVKTNVPVYLGMFNHDPEAKPGDWYTYNGPDTENRKTSYLYKYIKNDDDTYSWRELSTTDTENYSYYMQALPDVMNAKTTELTTGYFATIFANSIMTNTAFIKKLATQIIELQTGGSIKSHNYIPGEQGFMLDGDTGNLDAGDGNFRGELITGVLDIRIKDTPRLLYKKYLAEHMYTREEIVGLIYIVLGFTNGIFDDYERGMATIDLTQCSNEVEFVSNGIVASKAVVRIFISRATTIYLYVFDENDNLLDRIEFGGSVFVETFPFTYDFEIYLKSDNKKFTKLKSDYEYPIPVENAVFSHNGLIQTYNKNPLYKFVWPAGTNYTTILGDIYSRIKRVTTGSNAQEVSCIGHYGSEGIDKIWFYADYILIRRGDTNKITLRYDDISKTITSELAILFIGTAD